MSQPPDYPPPPPAPPTPTYGRPPENGLGLAAMIVGIASFFVLAPLSSTGAIILGVLGLRKVRAGQATNRGQALTGVICGAVSLVLGLVVIIYVVAVLSHNVNTSP